MSCTDTLEIIRLTAPEFNEVPEDVIEKWTEICAPMVSRKKFGKLYQQALAFLVCHKLKMSGLGDNAFGSIADTYRVSSYSEGSTSISFNSGYTSGNVTTGELNLTHYGLQYIELRKLVVVPITISGVENG